MCLLSHFQFSSVQSLSHVRLFETPWITACQASLSIRGVVLQHHSSKASILRRSAFFTVQLSHPYMTTGKTIALTRQIFVGKVISLLLNMLSRLVITFVPRSKHLLISWLQSPSAVILEPQKIKSDTVSTVSPSISHEVMGPDAMILVFWMLSFSHVQFFPTLWTVALEAPPGKNTGVGCHALLQVISLTWELNPHLLHLLHWQVSTLPLPGKPLNKVILTKDRI